MDETLHLISSSEIKTCGDQGAPFGWIFWIMNFYNLKNLTSRSFQLVVKQYIAIKTVIVYTQNKDRFKVDNVLIW